MYTGGHTGGKKSLFIDYGRSLAVSECGSGPNKGDRRPRCVGGRCIKAFITVNWTGLFCVGRYVQVTALYK